MKDPNFSGYHAKRIGSRSPRGLLRRVKMQLYGAVLFPYGTYKHQRLLRDCKRVDNHTYTCFLRAPSQLRALTGPVLDFLGNPEREGRRLNILMFACSNGAEAYTIASWLMMKVPQLDFHITGSDLHQQMVERCVAAEYSEAEALHSDYVTREFVEATFDRKGDRYVVKPSIRERASFSQANLLDAEGLDKQFKPADLVTAQNVLFHLTPPDARKAFANVAKFLAPRSVLLVEGMDPDLRVELTRLHGLEPLTHDLRKIYSETRVHTPADWWNYYWGSEPYFPLRPDKERRYGTIFLRGAGSGGRTS